MMRNYFLLTAAALIIAAISTSAQNYSEQNAALFEPEFRAYQYGRKTDENGQGYQWYRRFVIFHITDIHNCSTIESDAINLAQGRADVVVNSGDDSNFCTAEYAEATKEILTLSSQTINTANTNKVPVIQVPGNHDMPGVRKCDYFKRICSGTVQAFNPEIVWGDEAGQRAYGYCDYSSGPEMDASFRIIMLDPFDYDDGQFEVRKFMTATFSQKQIDWLVSVLKDAALNGLKVITVMHYSFGDNDLYFNEERAKPDAHFYQDSFMIPDIIDAAQHGNHLHRTYPDELGTDNINVNADFSNFPALEFVCHLFGHIHSKNDYRCQKTDGSKIYDILMLGEASLSGVGTALNKVCQPRGTINQPAFSALSIDTIEKCIYRTSYGAYLKYDGSNSRRTEKINYKFQTPSTSSWHPTEALPQN